MELSDSASVNASGSKASNMSSPLSGAKLSVDGDEHVQADGTRTLHGHVQADSTTTATSAAPFDSSDFSMSENEQAQPQGLGQARKLSKAKASRVLSSVKELTYSQERQFQEDDLLPVNESAKREKLIVKFNKKVSGSGENLLGDASTNRKKKRTPNALRRHHTEGANPAPGSAEVGSAKRTLLDYEEDNLVVEDCGGSNTPTARRVLDDEERTPPMKKKFSAWEFDDAEDAFKVSLERQKESQKAKAAEDKKAWARHAKKKKEQTPPGKLQPSLSDKFFFLRKTSSWVQ